MTRKECGSSTILGCRYHGWSYDTKGQLTKAPEFDQVPGFNRSENGLWEIHTRISTQGLVFVNLYAAESVEDLNLVELGKDFRGWSMIDSLRVTEWKQEGIFNWKLVGKSKRFPGFGERGIWSFNHLQQKLLGDQSKMMNQCYQLISQIQHFGYRSC